MASKKSSETPPEKNKYLAIYPRTRWIYSDDKEEWRKNLNKPIKNADWKEIQKIIKEKAAQAKARSILKKKQKKKRAAVTKQCN